MLASKVIIHHFVLDGNLFGRMAGKIVQAAECTRDGDLVGPIAYRIPSRSGLKVVAGNIGAIAP